MVFNPIRGHDEDTCRECGGPLDPNDQLAMDTGYCSSVCYETGGEYDEEEDDEPSNGGASMNP